jgi:N6-L-threonylcarbamoyladenine synthase
MIILGLETSCDETAVAIVNAATRQVLAQTVYVQTVEHAPYGGVVPELAARAHSARLPSLIQQTLTASGLPMQQLHAVAATVGPGLTTALTLGATMGKTLAMALNLPFLATNHIEGHALTPHLSVTPTVNGSTHVEFPYLLMLLTGGHCQIVKVDDVGAYTLLGTTLDDAVGECFDKVGKLLGLPHPAGPAIEQLAKQGNPQAIPLANPKHDATLDFSFSGLKSSVRDYMQKHPDAPKPDVAASFQHTVATILARKLGLALQHTGAKQAVAAGGVAANATIRAALLATCTQHGATFAAPPLSLCTDNAVMIAYAAGLRAMAGLPNLGLASPVYPRWPLPAMNTPTAS